MADFTYKWLVWDGTYSLLGSCNQYSDVEEGLAGQEQLLMPALNIPLQQDPKTPPLSTVGATAISVRILTMVESPEHWLAIKVRLKRLKKIDGSWNIKSLMLRVYRNYDAAWGQDVLPKENLVYQEILRKDAIDALPDARLDGDDDVPMIEHEPRFRSGGSLVTDKPEARHSPYKIRVWVSALKNAFGKAGDDLAPYTDEPEIRYTLQAHDQYRPTDKDFQEKFRFSGKDSAAWEAYMNKRKATAQERKYEDQPGKNVTTLPYDAVLAPAAESALVRATLEGAASSGVPFTEGLMEVAVATSGRA